jgi:O-acetyl-ADP-ribose deacetylase (regulator of RNase III)
VVKYHGLARHYLTCLGFLMRPLLNGGTLGGPVTEIRVELGDITTMAVDAIVNAANESLLGGGGVDGAIHDAAGPRLLEACRQIPEVRPGIRCSAGEARITQGFDLPARFIVHTVGPVWRGGQRREREILASCYRNIFELCSSHQIRSVAIPAISCGAFGFPIVEASAIAAREIGYAMAGGLSVDTVLLAAFDRETHAAVTKAVRASGLLRS